MPLRGRQDDPGGGPLLYTSKRAVVQRARRRQGGVGHNSKSVYADLNRSGDCSTPQVSNIAQSILSELDRVRGTRMTLTLDIDAETADGFPEDVESVVRDNAAGLRITDFGFEGE